MSISAHGIVQGDLIQLDAAIGLPSGSEVDLVVTRRRRPTQAEVTQVVAAIAGCMIGDKGFAAAMDELEHDRANVMPPEIDFHEAP